MPDMRRSASPRLPRTSRLADPCPRRQLAGAADRGGHSLASLSRMIGRRDGYLAYFVREGRPAALSEREHRLLCDFFGVDERGLGVRELWAPMAA